MNNHAVAEVEDIFFLKRNEFLECFDECPSKDVIEQITARKQQWHRAVQASKNTDMNQQLPQQNSLRGIGVSAGYVEARAVVVHSFTDAQKIESGRILVTRSVDPAWTPVFAKAGGLILEVGGVLSHASI